MEAKEDSESPLYMCEVFAINYGTFLTDRLADIYRGNITGNYLKLEALQKLEEFKEAMDGVLVLKESGKNKKSPWNKDAMEFYSKISGIVEQGSAKSSKTVDADFFQEASQILKGTLKCKDSRYRSKK